MFTLPPLPPKDYVLRGVYQNQVSNPEHTPDALPRVTQLTLAKFCHPVEYKDKEALSQIVVEPVNPRVLDRWTDKSRVFWVDKPGKNDYFLHDVSKKYNVVVEESYDSRYRHKEQVFYRPFRYEFDCIEENRLEKLREKMERERDEGIHSETKGGPESLKAQSCKLPPPFWWKEQNVTKAAAAPLDLPKISKGVKPLTSTYQESYGRWQDEPDVMAHYTTNACQRRRDMALFGQPFRNEACNWYYKNYPPPDLRRIHKHFV